MHIPDHVLDPVTVAATTATAIAAVSYAAVKVRREGTPVKAGFAAAVTGLIFAAQMVNFPVLAGTSGHLIGGAIAAALLGPWLGILSVTSVLLIQALVFADGGLGALGANITVMAVVGVAVAYGVQRATDRRAAHAAPVLGAGLGAVAAVVAGATVITGLYLLSGAVVAPGAFAAQMLGVHVLIAGAEGALTVVAVSLVRRAGAPRSAQEAASQGRATMVVGASALVIGGALSSLAIAWPDGLERVSALHGVEGAAPVLGSLWLAGYGGLPLPLVGLIGVVAAAALIVGAMRGVAAMRPAAV